jgi:acetyl esterase/lipase
VDTAHGERPFLLLWPEGAPGAVGTEPADRPKVTAYPAASPNGAAVLVCPGGSYRTLASDHEGRRVAEWLNSLGVSAFVLQYRVGPRYRFPVPLQDAQRALRLLRARAGELGFDPARLGILGFSAGGHLAATASTEPGAGDPSAADPVDRLDARPAFAILGYPVISMSAPFAHRGSVASLLGDAPTDAQRDALSNEKRAGPGTPATFVFHTADDATVPVENALAYASALRAAGVPVELHVFPRGRHGLGLAAEDASVSQWTALCAAWLRAGGFLDPREAPEGRR